MASKAKKSKSASSSSSNLDNLRKACEDAGLVYEHHFEGQEPSNNNNTRRVEFQNNKNKNNNDHQVEVVKVSNNNSNDECSRGATTTAKKKKGDVLSAGMNIIATEEKEEDDDGTISKQKDTTTTTTTIEGVNNRNDESNGSAQQLTPNKNNNNNNNNNKQQTLNTKYMIEIERAALMKEWMPKKTIKSLLLDLGVPESDYSAVLRHCVGNAIKRNSRKANKISRQKEKEKVQKENEVVKKEKEKGKKKEWEIMYKRLMEYKVKHGNCLVPYAYSEDRELGLWVDRQRRQFKKKNDNLLQPDEDFDDNDNDDGLYYLRLKSIGFVFKVEEERWNDNYQKLKLYKEKHGNCLVSGSYQNDNPDGNKLNTWVKTQRQMKKKGTLLPERQMLLDEINFAWEISTEECQKLRNTASLQKRKLQQEQKKNQKEEEERQQKRRPYNGASNQYKINNSRWDEMYNRLVSYKDVHGHCRVPAGYVEDPSLANWVMNQRLVKKKRGNLLPERQRKLVELGFVWSILGNSKCDDYKK